MDSDAAGDFIVIGFGADAYQKQNASAHEPEDDPRSALVQTLMDYSDGQGALRMVFGEGKDLRRKILQGRGRA